MRGLLKSAKFLMASFAFLSTAGLIDGGVTANAANNMSGGYGHSCAIKNDSVYCWGWNFYGQLGLGHNENATGAKRVADLPGKALHVSTRKTHTCAITTEGTYCWGKDTFGTLGIGERGHRNLPTKLKFPEGSQVTDISAGDIHTCAVVDGGVMCWGWNYSCALGKTSCAGGQPSTEDMELSPRWVDGLPAGSGATKVVATDSHTCAMVRGGLQCWGWNIYSKLGNTIDDMNYYPLPQWVRWMGENTKVTDVSAGENFTCAVQRGDLLCWGRPEHVGRGKGVYDSATPTVVPKLDRSQNPILPSGNKTNTCTINKRNQVVCFGFNMMGQLADPSFQSDLKATVISGLPAGKTWVHTSVGSSHACARSSDDQIWCWGYNAFCQLGDGRCDNGAGDARQPIPQRTLGF